MANINQTPNGRWMVRWWDNGKYRGKTYATEAEAHMQLALVLDPTLAKTFKPVRRATKNPKPPPPLLTDGQVGKILDAAREAGEERYGILRFLSRYGTRPISVCRMRVEDFDPGTGTVRFQAKRVGWKTHPLFPDDVELLRRLAGLRGPKAPLFLGPKGKQWQIVVDESHPKGHATGLATWYARTLAKVVALPKEQSGIYLLKDYAITKMLAGEAPWPAPLTPADVALFTGHRTLHTILRYNITNNLRAMRWVGRTGEKGVAGQRSDAINCAVPDNVDTDAQNHATQEHEERA